MARNLAAFSAFLVAILSVVVLRSQIPSWWHLSSPVHADLVVWNATIFTADASMPFADAMAIRNGRIMQVGSYSSLQGLIGQPTRDFNFEGKIITPGFFDSHLHFLSGGLQMAQVELRGVKDREEFCRMVKEAAKDKNRGEWILGGGWNNDLWGGDLPSSSWIDDVSYKNPVWLSRMDGHMGLANSLALKMAGITNETGNPTGGAIIRTASGEPTGVLVDSAMDLILSFIPQISIDERRIALGRASRHALSKGVTTVIDFGRYLPGKSADDVWLDFRDVYQWADSAGKILTRVCLYFPIETWSQLAGYIQEKGRTLSEYIYLGGTKAFADGSLGSSSALFYEHYVDEPNNYGLQVTDLDWLLNVTSESDISCLQVAIHAIGDKANDLILDLYSSVEALNGKRDRRFRIEHAQHLAVGSAARFGKQEVLASVQPQHLLDDADSAERKIGADRSWKGSYMFQTLLSNHVQLAFGSDWPVSDINPLGSIKTAMNRIPPGWSTAWNLSECISLNDALIASTISAAYASFLEKDLGSLSPGKLADFVVLSASSWNAFASDPDVPVLATFVGGVQVYP